MTKGKVLSEHERPEARRLAREGLGVHEIARTLSRSSKQVSAVLRGEYNPTRVLSLNLVERNYWNHKAHCRVRGATKLALAHQHQGRGPSGSTGTPRRGVLRTRATWYTVSGLDTNQMSRTARLRRRGRSVRSVIRALRYAALAAAGLVVAFLAISVASSGRGGVGASPSGQSFGARSGMHVVVRGNQHQGYFAEVYDGGTFVTGRGMVGAWDLTVLPGTSSYEPTGPNLLGPRPTSDLGWRGPVGALPRKGNRGWLREGTAPDGRRGINWAQGPAAGRTWIYAQLTQDLTTGEEYQVRVTLQGSGYVFLDFYNRQVDLTTVPVHLSPVPTTLTLDGPVQQGTRNALLQVSAASASPVDLWVTSASVQTMKFRPVTRQDRVRNEYRRFCTTPPPRR